MHQTGLLLRLFLPIFTGIALTACSLFERGVVTPPDRDQAVLVFVSGEVSLGRGSHWRSAEAGNLVNEGESLRTGPGAWCEIQIGDRALVGINENTVVEIDTLFDRKLGSRIGIGLVSGSVACKVNTLLDNEDFQVRTETTVVGVRGTLFAVTREGDTVLVSVARGSVSVAPRLDFAELSALSPDSATTDFLVALWDQFPLVGEGEETVVSPETLHRATLAWNSMKNLLSARSMSNPEDRPYLEQTGAALTAFGTRQPLSVRNRGILDRIEASTFRSFESRTSTRTVRAVVSAGPGDSLFLDSTLAGRGSVSFLSSAGRQVLVTASRPGYRSDEKVLTLTERGPNTIVFSLEKIPEKRFVLITEPATADIFLEGRKVGTGRYDGVLTGGDHGRVLVTAPGYNNQWVRILFDENDGEEIHVTLEQALAQNWNVSGSRIIGLAGGDGILIAGDSSGTQVALNQVGKTLWTIPTRNGTSGSLAPEKTTPAFSGSSIAFSGMNELVLVDPGTGKAFFRRPLDVTEQLTMDRRPLDARGILAHPTNDGFKLIDPGSGEVLKTVAIPGGTRMTPLYYGGRLFTVALDGTVYLHTVSGEPVGELKTGAGQTYALSISVSGSRGYFSDRNGHIVCLDLVSGRILWETDLEPRGSHAVKEDLAVEGDLVVIFSRGALHGISSETGEALWTSEERFIVPPLILGPFVCTGTAEGELVYLDRKRGTVYQSTSLGGRITSKLVIWNGYLWLGTANGRVMGIRVPVIPEDESASW